MRRRIHPWRRRLGFVAAVLAGLVAAEFGFRALLFGDAEAFASWRNPNLYADRDAGDDYWLLYNRFGGEYKPPALGHPVLGWVGHFDRDTFVHAQTDEGAGRRPVLLYGSSFAAGAPYAEPFQDILNADAEFAHAHFLLNYGVGGYGPDQVLLLLQRSLPRYERPFVILSLVTVDLDRCILSVRTGQKPRFRVVDGRLLYPQEPIEPDPARYFAAHPPEVFSYLWRCLAHGGVWPQSLRSWLVGEPAVVAEKQELSRLLLDETLGELRARGVDFTLLVFYPRPDGPPDAEDWRDAFLADYVAARHLPCIWVKQLLDPAQLQSKGAADEFFGSDRHPTTRLNAIVAEAIKHAVLAHDAHVGGESASQR